MEKTIEIPEGYEARIEGNKVILEPKESKDERIRNLLYCLIRDRSDNGKLLEHNGVSVDMALAWIEKQGKQNLANSEKTCKVEPKFKVGDWVVYDGWVTQILQVCQDGYVNIHQGFIPKEREEIMRLWTIQDAKEGDVLVGNYDNCKKPWIGIFKCISKDRPTTQFDSYCFLNSSHHIFTTPLSCDFYNQCKGHTIRYALPATKEQRDLLFQKMKEAGYEWDSEKKELKKIEQNPAWTEEDEGYYNSIIEHLKYSITNGKPETYKSGRLTDFLRSLKERYTWKPSDGQIQALELVVQYHAFANTDNREKIVALFNDLKKLKKR